MKVLLLILALIAISGCAQMEERKHQALLDQQRVQLSAFVESNRPRVDSGEMRWSDYYRGLYDIYNASAFTDRGIMMQALATGIGKAQQFESGEITKREFEQYKLKQQADIVAQQELAAKDEADRKMRAVQAYYGSGAAASPQNGYRPIQLPTYQIPPSRSTNCTSNRVGETVYTNCY